MKKILTPKTLAITTIITTIIVFILSIISSAFNNPLYLRAGQIMGNIGGFVFGGSLYIIIYLLIILRKKQKNIKLLNTILFINFIIATLFYLARQIIYIKDIYSVATTITNFDNMFIFKMFFSLISNTLFLVIETLMVYGILRKKNLPYKTFMVILVALTFGGFIFTIIYSLLYSDISLNWFNLLSNIIGIIKSCSFVLFIYLYGKSISERSKNNE